MSDKCFSMLGMNIKHPERKGTPQPKPESYLCPKRPEFATTGESPNFTMSAEPQTALIGGGVPFLAQKR